MGLLKLQWRRIDLTTFLKVVKSGASGIIWKSQKYCVYSQSEKTISPKLLPIVLNFID